MVRAGTPMEKIDKMLSKWDHRVGSNPLFKKLIRERFWPTNTRKLDGIDQLFFNFGYEEDPPMGLQLDASDEPNRVWIQHYYHLASQADLAGKDVLEVSCGHGGGASYLVRTFAPSSYTGLDFNEPGIEFCKKRHHQPGLRFVHGNAEELPFPDRSFDVVINMEASHIYDHFERFLGEVTRVLRPGGHFLYADYRPRESVPAWEEALAHAPMQLVAREDVNAEVVRSLRLTTPRSIEQINHASPFFMRGFAKQMSWVEGSRAFRDVERGDICYRQHHFVRD